MWRQNQKKSVSIPISKLREITVFLFMDRKDPVETGKKKKANAEERKITELMSLRRQEEMDSSTEGEFYFVRSMEETNRR